MSKLKTLYELVKAIQEQSSWQGALQLRLLEDGNEVWSMHNQFERNAATGWQRVTTQTELLRGGRRLSHSGTTEFEPGEGCHFAHWQHRRHPAGSAGQFGFNRLAFGLKLLNELVLEEQADGGKLLKLEMDQLPAEFRQRCQQALAAHGHQTDHCGPHQVHPGCLPELQSLSVAAVRLGLLLDSNSRPAQANLQLVGTIPSPEGERNVQLLGELTLQR